MQYYLRNKIAFLGYLAFLDL